VPRKSRDRAEWERTKYAEATTASVRLAEVDGRLDFDVTDDGRGFDVAATRMGTGVQGIMDRLAALGWKPEVAFEDGLAETVDWFRRDYPPEVAP